MNIEDGIKLTEEQAVAVIAQDINRNATAFFGDANYAEIFEKVAGYPIASDKVSSEVAHFRNAMFGGAMMASAYLQLACREVADARLDRIWRKIMYSNINEVYGLKKYCEAARSWIEAMTKEKPLMSMLGGKPTGDKVQDKMNGICGLGGLWIADKLVPQPKCSPTSTPWFVFMALHQKPIRRFTILMMGLLDKLYGEPIPLPPPKKGFFGSLFG